MVHAGIAVFRNGVQEIASRVGILEENIHYLNASNKSSFYINNPGFIFHLDDSWFTVDDVNEYSDSLGICVLEHGWMLKCDELLTKDPMTNTSNKFLRKYISNLVKEMKGGGVSSVQLLEDIKKDVKKMIKDERRKADK